jgi:hypothetical protein
MIWPVSKMFRLPYIFSTVFCLYAISAVCLLYMLNFNPPSIVEIAISVYAVPFMFMFQPLYPLFKSMNMLEGEWWTMPTPLGMGIGIVVYGTVLLAIGKLILLFKIR